MNKSNRTPYKLILACAGLALVVAIWMLRPAQSTPPAVAVHTDLPADRASEPKREKPSPVPAAPPAEPPRHPREDPALRYQSDPIPPEAIIHNFPDFKLRPFAVAKETGLHQWTSEDGRDPAAIRRLAHNHLEEARHHQENDYVKQRQLVYRKESFEELGKRVNRGEQIKSVMIPGFDGQEWEVEVTRTMVEKRLREGSFLGHIKGQPGTHVVLAYFEDRDYFRVDWSNGFETEGEPREANEIVLKQIDSSLRPAPWEPNEDDTRNPFDIGKPLASQQK